MRKVYRVFPLLVLLVLLFFDNGLASVVGAWDISGKMTIKVSIKGYGSQKQTEYFYDEFVFHDDGSFDMIDASGTWRQKGKNFTIYLNTSYIEYFFEEFLEEAFEDYGLDAYVDVTVKKITFKGVENKNGTIKGNFNYTLGLYIDIEDEVFRGTVSVSGTYTGVKSSGYFSMEEEKSKHNMNGNNLLIKMKESLENIADSIVQ